MYKPASLITMLSPPILVPLFLLALSIPPVFSSPCVAFDINNNLLAFGLGGKDWNAGTQNGWSTATSATDITTTGRPPFDAKNTTCYLAQFFNAIYVLNADSADHSSVYIYDATKKSWSTQKVTAGTFDPTTSQAILDHDTNIFYAISHNELYTLDMGVMTSANSSPIAWTDVEQPPFNSTVYQPVMALAQNHIHFMGIPGVPAGVAFIYVIHFNYFQPDLQPYPVQGSGSPFPDIHGQATSFFQASGVQQEFAFIPDDFSGTYVVNVESNQTYVLAPPTSKDTGATYFAGITSLVQLDSKGTVYYLPYAQGDIAANAAATWSTIKSLPINTSSSSSGSTSSSRTGTSSSRPSSTGGSAQSSSSKAILSSQFSGTAVAAVCLVAMIGLS